MLALLSVRARRSAGAAGRSRRILASIANEGLRPAPHVVESIERNGVVIYRHDPKSSVTIKSVDRAAFYQLKTMLQGVLARGTARTIGGLSPYVAGKTGTSDDENDAWFVGFTNDVTVAVWIAQH